MIDFENMNDECRYECNDKLTEILSKVGKEYNYDNVEAEFMAFREIKVRWQRSYRWIAFKISDYLTDAPDTVLEGLGRSLFERLSNGNGDYPTEVLEWLISPEFSKDKRPVYMNRCSNYLNTAKGKSKNLQDSYDRLVGAGLIAYDPTIALTWEEEGSYKMGHCSVLMRVVAISKRLDREDVPDYVLDYCLYHELCHIAVGYNPDGNMHEDDYCEMEDKFPTKAEAVGWLRTQDSYA